MKILGEGQLSNAVDRAIAHAVAPGLHRRVHHRVHQQHPARSGDAEDRRRLSGKPALSCRAWRPVPSIRRHTHKHTNRLIHETSPYLLQHAHNPVDWRPWGDEAFDEARRLGKPVFLSIGYSTCHWCHVMEEESFEDEEIAAAMNDLYVSIKVDREERPDVDAIYMTAVQALTGSGGWPMSVWLTPDREPFFGGTYFPPRDGARGARHGFLTVLRDVREAYVSDPERVGRATAALVAAVRTRMEANRGGRARRARFHVAVADPRHDRRCSSACSTTATAACAARPSSRRTCRSACCCARTPATGDDVALLMAALTLEKMAAGGMYDQLGGRLPPLFHRRALAGAALREDALRQRAADRRLRRGPPGDGARRLRPRRARHARLSAARDDRPRRRLLFGDRRRFEAPDGKSEEGAFFVWSEAEIRQVLGAGPETERFIRYYGVTAGGNFEGANILARRRAPSRRRGTRRARAPARRRCTRSRAQAVAPVPRRQDPRRLERSGDLRGGGGGRDLRRAPLRRRRRARGDVRARQDAAGRPARAQRQGRPRRGRRLPR